MEFVDPNKEVEDHAKKMKTKAQQDKQNGITSNLINTISPRGIKDNLDRKVLEAGYNNFDEYTRERKEMLRSRPLSAQPTDTIRDDDLARVNQTVGGKKKRHTKRRHTKTRIPKRRRPTKRKSKKVRKSKRRN